ncbi:MAG: DUF374 domain-containing protein [Acidobacteria bacterium]|nr:MAG: DUF374 domain-containing protein [Acidobacteriota bacterium]
MAAIEFFLRLMFRLYCASLRVKALLPDGTLIPLRELPFRRVIFAHPERITLAVLPASLLAPFVLLLAPGRDGDRAEIFLRSVGCRLVRASSRRSGATGLKRLIDLLRNHAGPAALSVDGPIGPPGTAKPGIISCALHTGRPVVPLGAAATHRLVFRQSWSQMFLPLPGSRVVIVIDQDFPVVPPQSREGIEKLTEQLVVRLKLAQERADNALSLARESAANSLTRSDR